MKYPFQLGRRPKGNGDGFLPVSDQSDDLDEFDELGEDEDDSVEEEEEALDEELNFDKPHFRRLGFDYEEEEEE